MEKNLYGLLAEFDTPTQVVDAANAVREAGFTKTDAFSPFPMHENAMNSYPKIFFREKFEINSLTTPIPGRIMM